MSGTCIHPNLSKKKGVTGGLERGHTGNSLEWRVWESVQVGWEVHLSKRRQHATHIGFTFFKSDNLSISLSGLHSARDSAQNLPTVIREKGVANRVSGSKIMSLFKDRKSSRRRKIHFYTSSEGGPLWRTNLFAPGRIKKGGAEGEDEVDSVKSDVCIFW